MTTILAQATVEVPWKYLPPWMFGLIAFMAVVLLFLMVIHYSIKLFGRNPPIHDSLKSLAKNLKSEIHREKNSVLKEIRLTLVPMKNELEQSKTDIQDIKMDRVRKWETLTNQFHEIDLKVANLTGRIETLLEKLEDK